ncbi:hypothetical protein [Haloarchaeobius amylolyticus]|uniref:hypothetical protein n=1 Tax=Haloarchaeobius amylolyticus TaxID=1198296 RepID=UPI00227124C1|nr:hypothetical protein [Haloarchaeobius amylolyticus]
MEDNDFTQTQKEKVRLLSEYRSDFDELLEAAEKLRQRSVEEWPEQFQKQLSDDLWSEEWMIRCEPREYGCIFKHGWYLNDENLEPTNVAEETNGYSGLRLHFNHLIRSEQSFSQGQLTYRLRCPTNVPLRDEFHQLYNSEQWQSKLEPLLDEKGITNKGNKRDYMQKTYDVDQSGLPESYFKTLVVAFKEYLEIADIVDEILDEARVNIKD